jgi:predicted metal-dependent phosphoesterase TrpH
MQERPFERAFHKEIVRELDEFLTEQKNRFPQKEILTMDLHVHDHNSNVPDEILGRILRVPETYLPTDDLLGTLKQHGCDALTITNHNNARSCYELQDRGLDVLTAAEFSCMVPDYHVGIHVLTYGFSPEQEKDLDRLRRDIYRFQEYTHENDIPTIWAHPLYHYQKKGLPPMEFFEKLCCSSSASRL